MKFFDDGYAHLSASRALLGAVTPNLRAVTVKLNQEQKKVTVRFYYDGKITEEDFDTANIAITEIISDFPPEYDLDDDIQRIDCPHPIDFDGRVVFKRKE